ncbi:polyhydroxyalkanoate synthesis repressor PhaR [Polymorphobacter sp. PAMC 29334]|uniref:polyhydroxyalkanoate synthesis repressor PhaR n=1 Tax=Polymorphobacter sp. PAMC 29334 TaxID=2862331 RepID=UPI001C77F097|nr:polyhydroxyalkanoate synthesis repressor PhaR [Polymorphobacter sp. PAMC 29334]QYE35191.1 polyhydroxyalkanoate synthesis repressor PhaR [Polymorphobacter sp. PAMC 29334]
MDQVRSADPAKQIPVVIKKYANRRLYNTDTSSYITLEHLAVMTRQGRDFQVFDAKTGEDITHNVLTQIVMDGENGGQTMLPVPFLRQLIAMYGDSMQSMVPHYLEASMAAFAKNQAQFRDSVAGAFGGAAFKPFETLAKQNMAMFQAAADMLTGRAALVKSEPAKAETGELDALKAQMVTLQAQLEKLSKV